MHATVAKASADAVPGDMDAGRGLRCGHCGCGRLRVVYTRRRSGGIVVRRRACTACGWRGTTMERFVDHPGPIAAATVDEVSNRHHR